MPSVAGDSGYFCNTGNTQKYDKMLYRKFCKNVIKNTVTFNMRLIALHYYI